MSQEETAVRPIEELSLLELYERQVSLVASATAVKDDLGALSGEILRRLEESGKRTLAQADKEHGTFTLELQDGLKAKGDIKKVVDWDSPKLMAIAQTMAWDRVKEIFKIDFSVSETIYKGIGAGNPELKKQIDTARTVKAAPTKITLVRE